MKVSELFYSIQGEGKLVGAPSVFIRASGCNLRCVWCDTPYASWDPEGDDLSVNEILRQVDALLPSSPTPGSEPSGDDPDSFHPRPSHVVLTGGEPLIMPDITDLCAALKAQGHHLTIETAATVYKPLPIDLASLSPKLSNSTPWQREAGRFAQAHERQRLRPDVCQAFIDSAPDFQLKFVVSSEKDLDEIRSLLDQLKGWHPADVLLMPEGTDRDTLRSRADWIGEICKSTGFRYCPRLHVELYGNRRGT